MPLNTDFNLGTEGDGLFNDLLNAHDGLTDDESSQLNAATTASTTVGSTTLQSVHISPCVPV